VTIRIKPKFVDESMCTGCDECSKSCPIEVFSDFDQHLVFRKAIYIPFPQGMPRTYSIDIENCVRCYKCVDACAANAIHFGQKTRYTILNVGAVVVATGYNQINPSKYGEYSYGRHPDIVTNLQFERIMHSGFRRLSNGQLPKKVAFLLCVGSRSLQENAREHCCKIGCMVAIKQAIMLKKAVPDVEPWIFYQDIRANGKGYEEFYARAREQGVKFVRGLAATVIPDADGLVVKSEDTIAGTPIETKFDLVVLSTEIVAGLDTDEISKIFGLHIGPDGFLLERHYKLKPVDSNREGIFLCGCCLGPKDIRESVEESMAAASRASNFIGQGERSVSPEVPVIDASKCKLCGKCVAVCPTNAISNLGSTMTVLPMACSNCGACVPACPYQAIDQKNFTERQIIEQIRGITSLESSEPKIVVFIERRTAYSSLDLAGTRRLLYSTNVRLIAVPSCMRIGVNHLIAAFAYGADGIALIEGDDSPFAGEKLLSYISDQKRILKERGISPLRIQSITVTIPQYEKATNFLATLCLRISKLGKITERERDNLRKITN